MKKFIKNNIRIFIGIVIGLSIAGITAYAISAGEIIK